MGQKVNPISLRLRQTNKSFDSCWSNDFYYTDLLSKDILIRRYLSSIVKRLKLPAPRFLIMNGIKELRVGVFFHNPKELRQKRAESFGGRVYERKKKKRNRFSLLKFKQNTGYVTLTSPRGGLARGAVNLRFTAAFEGFKKTSFFTVHSKKQNQLVSLTPFLPSLEMFPSNFYEKVRYVKRGFPAFSLKGVLYKRSNHFSTFGLKLFASKPVFLLDPVSSFFYFNKKKENLFLSKRGSVGNGVNPPSLFVEKNRSGGASPLTPLAGVSGGNSFQKPKNKVYTESLFLGKNRTVLEKKSKLGSKVVAALQREAVKHSFTTPFFTQLNKILFSGDLLLIQRSNNSQIKKKDRMEGSINFFFNLKKKKKLPQKSFDILKRNFNNNLIFTRKIVKKSFINNPQDPLLFFSPQKIKKIGLKREVEESGKLQNFATKIKPFQDRYAKDINFLEEIFNKKRACKASPLPVTD